MDGQGTKKKYIKGALSSNHDSIESKNVGSKSRNKEVFFTVKVIWTDFLHNA